MKHRSLFRPHTIALIALALWSGTSAETTVTEEYAAAEALGVFRENSEIVSIDFDVPRNGPLCITVDEGIVLRMAWEEYHNLYQFIDETSFVDCDFSTAMVVASEGMPRPDGITFKFLTWEEGNQIPHAPSYFACSKICASNGHKVKVCRGGLFGDPSDCNTTPECSPERTVDVRSTPREYVPVGKVCRPKNGDGYARASGVDTPESCRKKCDDEATKCGAWEFEDHDLDNKECELHEIDVVSYEETLAMGDCEITNTTGDDDYRCCWIAKEVVEAQIEKQNEVFIDPPEAPMVLLASGQQTRNGLFYTTVSTIVAFLANHI